MRACHTAVPLVYLAVLLASCSRKDEAVCNIRQSTPVQITVTDSTGSSYVQECGYDSLHRLMHITNFGRKLDLDITYLTNDSVLYRQSDGQISLRAFTPQGDRLFTKNINFSASGDTEVVGLFHHTYDALRQRVQSLGTNLNYFSGKPDRVRPYDSTTYNWVDGNIVSSTSSRYGTATYTYFPNTDGLAFTNTPEDAVAPVIYLYSSTSRAVYSRNLVREIKFSSGAVITYRYDVDKAGRVTKMTISPKGNTPATYYPAREWSYSYQCI